MDAAPQPQPRSEGAPGPEGQESQEEQVNVYELTPSKSEAQEALEKASPDAAAEVEPLPQSQTIEAKAEQAVNVSILEKLETGLKIKKQTPAANTEDQPKTPMSVWVDRVKNLIAKMGKRPYEEQRGAQALEEGYLEENNISLKDNGEKK